MDRAEKALEFKRKNNCCQAVMLAFSDKLPFDDKTLRQIGSGFGAGMGCMEATCGALCGAVTVAGLLNSTGKSTTTLSRAILKEFESRSGATICRDLKGISTGKVLCSCDDCVRNAVLALENFISAG